MSHKLDTGELFPSVTIQVVDGGHLTLPDDLDSKYKVILFYRGHW